MKEFILRHKKGLSICGILLLAVVIGIIFVWKFLFPDGSISEYGNRLEGIEKVKISKSDLKKVETDIEAKEFVKSVDAYITGRIINVIVDVHNQTEVGKAKEVAGEIVGKFSEAEQQYYDIQIFLTNDSNEESSYPYIGYKHRTGTEIFWSNNQ